MRRLQPDGVCECCGTVGPTFTDVERDGIGGFQTTDAPALPPLCDRCDYAQRRWEAWQDYLERPGRGYPFTDAPPKSPPVRRATPTRNER